MKWLIDIITEAVLARFKNIISEWHGLLVDIPIGWILCDGNNGTPDLREKFIVGTSADENPGATGGSIIHGHTFTSNTHFHEIAHGLDSEVEEGTMLVGDEEESSSNTSNEVCTGSTNNINHVPPYYRLAFIMKT